MPLCKIEWTSDQSGWAIWHITETEQGLAALVDEHWPTDLTSMPKRLEWAAGRALIRALTARAGLPYHGLIKDDLGKPHLLRHPHFISLSNAFPYAAAQLDLQCPVGIDLERPREKILKIAHRVFNPGELRDAGRDVLKNCVYWCAKEALFKRQGKRGISFAANLSIAPFHLSESGDLEGTVSLANSRTPVKLRYLVESDFIVVYTRTT
jgi:4'-phosphopantetheinyl transferase